MRTKALLHNIKIHTNIYNTGPLILILTLLLWELTTFINVLKHNNKEKRDYIVINDINKYKT